MLLQPPYLLISHKFSVFKIQQGISSAYGQALTATFSILVFDY